MSVCWLDYTRSRYFAQEKGGLNWCLKIRYHYIKYVAAVEKQFLAYIKVENEIITREAMEKNLIFANNVYGTRTLVGINSTHKINPPAPIIKAEDFLLKK